MVLRWCAQAHPLNNDNGAFGKGCETAIDAQMLPKAYFWAAIIW
jgi:hypothetical protein